MENRKFKRGDKVRILPPVSGVENRIRSWNPDMLGHIGEVHTVRKESVFENAYFLDGVPYIWAEELLELCDKQADDGLEKTIKRGDIIEAMIMMTETDKTIKEMIATVPTLILLFPIISRALERTLFEEDD